jgi:hypothetical protein
MVRARLAALALAGGLLFVSGCSTFGSNGSSGGFSLFHRSSRRDCPVLACPSDCCDVGCPVPCCPPACPTPGCATGCGPGVPLISNAHPIMEGPALFPPSPAPFPGATMPPAMAPRPNGLPQIITVPQATMTPSPP